MLVYLGLWMILSLLVPTNKKILPWLSLGQKLQEGVKGPEF